MCILYITPNTPEQIKIKMPVIDFTLNNIPAVLEMCRTDELVREMVISIFSSSVIKKDKTPEVYASMDADLQAGGESAKGIIELAAEMWERKHDKKKKEEKQAKSAARKEGWDKRWKVGEYKFKSGNIEGKFCINKITKGGFALLEPMCPLGVGAHRRYLTKDKPILMNWGSYGDGTPHPIKITYECCEYLGV